MAVQRYCSHCERKNENAEKSNAKIEGGNLRKRRFEAVEVDLVEERYRWMRSRRG